MQNFKGGLKQPSTFIISNIYVQIDENYQHEVELTDRLARVIIFINNTLIMQKKITLH